MTWLNNGIPASICVNNPALYDHGFYRRLNDGRYEFVSFCHPTAKEMIGVHQRDFNRVLDELLPNQN